MGDETVKVTISEAKAATAKALMKIGWDEADATLQAEIMTAAEVCGNNQGLVKMYNPVLMKPAEGASKPTIERDTGSSAVVNGNQSPGMLAASMAADLAVKKVKEGGLTISIVSAYNTSTSSGQLGYYASKMAEQGVIGILMANSPEFVAAQKGGKAVFGTNPMAFGIPKAGGAPVVFDMATSAVALFGVLTAKAKGEPLAEGVACDSKGEYTTDAAAVLDGGAIQTFGGHKGAGLSLMIELLAGALSGGAVLGQVDSKKAAKSWGHTVIAIMPGFGSVETLSVGAGAMVKATGESGKVTMSNGHAHKVCGKWYMAEELSCLQGPLTDGFEEKAASICSTVKASGEGVRLPGESSATIKEERVSKDELPIPKKIWDMIQKTGEEGLP